MRQLGHHPVDVGWIVPRTWRLGTALIVLVSAELQRTRRRNQPTHDADLGRKLRQRALSSDRIIEQPWNRARGAGAWPARPSPSPRLAPRRRSAAAAPRCAVGSARGQHGRMEPGIVDGHAGHLSGDVGAQLPGGVAVVQGFQCLQHHHRGDHIGRHRRPSTFSLRGDQCRQRVAANSILANSSLRRGVSES